MRINLTPNTDHPTVEIDGEPAFEIRGYRLVTVDIANARSGLEVGANTLEIDDSSKFEPGDCVEIRNHFRFGRANYPLSQTVTITSSEKNQIWFEPPIADTVFKNLRGTFVRKVIRDVTIPLKANSQQNFITMRLTDRDIEIEGEITAPSDESKLNFFLNRHVKRDLNVELEALILAPIRKIKNVFTRSRIIHDRAFEANYWLNREGVSFEWGQAKELRLMGSNSISSISLHKENQAYDVTALTPFSRAPYDINALRSRNMRHYTGGVYQNGLCAFRARFATRQRLRGFHAAWHSASSAPELVTFQFENSDGTVAANRADCRVQNAEQLSCNIDFDQEVECDSVVVTMKAPTDGQSKFNARWFDFKYGGDNYLISVAIDSALDHPYYRVIGSNPLAAGTGGAKMEQRYHSRRAHGDVKSSDFSMELGEDFASSPRPFHISDGAPAAIIFTEHADSTILDSHRAAYLGRSDITAAKDAIGGFVYHNVPTTKTIFYSNPNKRPPKGYEAPQVALIDEPQFDVLCKELHAIGFDIGMHSPQPDNSSRATNKKAIRYMSDAYTARTWIDHSCSVVRSGVSACGLVHGQPHYIADLLEESTFRYFWQFGSEDFADQYLGGINIQQRRFGEWTVAPFLWRHESECGEMQFWPSAAGADLNVFNEAALDGLIKERGVAITHSYPAYLYERGISESPFFEKGEDQLLHVKPAFDQLLARLAKHRDRGNLKLTTIAEFCSYQEAIQNVRIYRKCSNWMLHNAGDEDISGFSFLIRAGEILLDSVEHNTRKIGHDLLITLDYPANAKIKIEIIN